MINPSHIFRFIFWGMLMLPSILTAQTISLIAPSELDPYGLKRVWYSQLPLHSADGKVGDILLEGGQLFITTSEAKLHVFDSETGKWLWSRSVGQRGIPLTEPAVNSRVVAVHNNLAVFLFNRKTGKQLMQIPLPESAAAACEMSEHYLYVPMVNKTLLVYALREALVPQIERDPEMSPIDRLIRTNDPGLEKIIQDFEEAKRLLLPPKPDNVEEDRFALDSTHRIPITCVAYGTLRTKPVLLSQFYTWVLDEEENPTHEIDASTHREFVAWATEQGFLHTANIARLTDQGMSMLYYVDSAGQTFYMDRTRSVQIDRPGNKEILSRPTQSQLYPVNELDPKKIILPDVIVTGGRAAYVFAIDSRTGNVRWKYPTQGQILESIAIIGMDIYAPTANGILHVIDLLSGRERWHTGNVKRFVAASQKRIYVLDPQDRLACLDRTTGVRLFTYDVRRFDHCLYNLETDQIFLLTNGGLVQCIREHQFSEEDRESSLRHRISSEEFTEAVRTGQTPHLWWTEGLGSEEEPREEWNPVEPILTESQS